MRLTAAGAELRRALGVDFAELGCAVAQRLDHLIPSHLDLHLGLLDLLGGHHVGAPGATVEPAGALQLHGVLVVTLQHVDSLMFQVV